MKCNPKRSQNTNETIEWNVTLRMDEILKNKRMKYPKTGEDTNKRIKLNVILNVGKITTKQLIEMKFKSAHDIYETIEWNVVLTVRGILRVKKRN